MVDLLRSIDGLRPEEDAPGAIQQDTWERRFCRNWFPTVASLARTTPERPKRDWEELNGVLDEWETLRLIPRSSIDAAQELLVAAQAIGGHPSVESPTELRELTGLQLSALQTDAFWYLRPPQVTGATSAIRCFLVLGQRDSTPASGVAAELLLALTPGHGEVVRSARHHWFLESDSSFEQSIAAATDAVAGLYSLRIPTDVNVRWSLFFPEYSEVNQIHRIQGSSMGFAFALALASLLGRHMNSELRHIDLSQVGATAEIGQSGKLSRVDGLWPKLGGVARQMGKDGYLRLVLVAEEQPGIPSEYLDEVGIPFDVCSVGDLRGAVAILEERSRDRHTATSATHLACSTFAALSTETQCREMAHFYCPLPVYEARPSASERTRGMEWDSGEGVLGQWPLLAQMGADFFSKLGWGPLASCSRCDLSGILDDLRRPGGHRVLVTGEAGSGKTVFLKHLAWQLSAPMEAASQPPLVRKRIPVFASLRQLGDQLQGAEVGTGTRSALAEFLAETVAGGKSGPSQELWDRWLSSGDVILFLDGLDELRGPAAQVVLSVLTSCPDCPAVVSCRSEFMADYRHLTRGFRVYRVGPVDTPFMQSFLKTFSDAPAWQTYWPEFGELVTLDPQLAAMSSNALMLSLFCLAARESEETSRRPGRQIELLDAALNALLRQSGAYMGRISPTLEELTARRVLDLSALRLLLACNSPQGFAFSAEELRRAAHDSLRDVMGEETEDLRASVPTFMEMIAETALLQGDARQYRFLHSIFHEFMAASALARLVQEGGLRARVPSEKFQGTVEQLVECKAWDGRWQKAIAFLIGMLDRPQAERLLRSLAAPHKDDILRHRLAVAVHCLAAKPQIGDSLRDQIAMAAVEFYISLQEHAQRCVSESDDDDQFLLNIVQSFFPTMAQMSGALDRDELAAVLPVLEVAQPVGPPPSNYGGHGLALAFFRCLGYMPSLWMSGCRVRGMAFAEWLAEALRGDGGDWPRAPEFPMSVLWALGPAAICMEQRVRDALGLLLREEYVLSKRRRMALAVLMPWCESLRGFNDFYGPLGAAFNTAESLTERQMAAECLVRIHTPEFFLPDVVRFLSQAVADPTALEGALAASRALSLVQDHCKPQELVSASLQPMIGGMDPQVLWFRAQAVCSFPEALSLRPDAIEEVLRLVDAPHPPRLRALVIGELASTGQAFAPASEIASRPDTMTATDDALSSQRLRAEAPSRLPPDSFLASKLFEALEEQLDHEGAEGLADFGFTCSQFDKYHVASSDLAVGFLNILRNREWPGEREAAAWCLGTMPNLARSYPEIPKVLVSALRDDAAPRVRRQAAQSLQCFPEEALVSCEARIALVGAAIGDSDSDVRQECLAALAAIGPPTREYQAAADMVLTGLQFPPVDAVAETLSVAQWVGPRFLAREQVVEAAAKALQETDDPQTKLIAVITLGQCGNMTMQNSFAVQTLRGLATEVFEPALQVAALNALWHAGDVKALEKALRFYAVLGVSGSIDSAIPEVVEHYRLLKKPWGPVLAPVSFLVDDPRTAFRRSISVLTSVACHVARGGRAARWLWRKLRRSQ